jgi:hypothetical protein
VATADDSRIRSRCGTAGNRFWSETAAEYVFANASSVSSTVRASSASAAAAPPPAIATRISSGWSGSRPRERTSTEPKPNWKNVGRRYPTPTPKNALRRSREKRV